MLAFLLVSFLFIIPIGLVIFMIVTSLMDSNNKTDYSHSSYQSSYSTRNDDYDDFYDDGYERGYEEGFRAASDSFAESEKKKQGREESAWKPLPDYVDDYGYYCPDCDADLLDDHCEHEDDWI